MSRTDISAPTSMARTGAATQKQGLYEESSTALHEIGTRLCLNDGRVFYYAKNGSSALAVGSVVVASQIVTTETVDNIATAHAAGKKDISWVAVGTITKDLYEQGWLVVNGGTGAGQTHKIYKNEAISASGSGKIYLNDGLVTALDTTSDVTLYKSLFNGVGVGTPGVAQQALALGTNPVAVTASYYFWLQTYGWACIKSGDALGNANNEREVFVHASGVTAISTANGAAGRQILGYRTYDSADAVASEWELVFITTLP